MSGINTKLTPSPELAEIVGTKKISRGQVMKAVWKYIKENDLQDEKDRRVIIPDEILGEVIGHKKIDMFKMTAKISAHLE